MTLVPSLSTRARRGDRKTRNRKPWALWIPGVVVLVVFVIPAIVPELLAPHDPLATDLHQRFQPPWFVGGDPNHLLGTDELGRDVLSRVIYGARASATIAISVVLLAATLGTALGIASAYLRGIVEAVTMRLADTAFSIPLVLMAIALATLWGSSLTLTVGVMVITLWPEYARVARGEALVVSEREFVLYARATGQRTSFILGRHILPNIVNGVIVLGTLHIAWAILVEAGLSFIGVGVPPPTPSWGSSIADGRAFISDAWWLTLMPGLALFIVVICLTLVGDWLRDRLDPQVQQGSPLR